MFNTEHGDWTQLRNLPNVKEVDFHWSQSGKRDIPYWEAMEQVYQAALEALKEAQQQGNDYLILNHGRSTSHPGKTTARAQVRRLMRS